MKVMRVCGNSVAMMLMVAYLLLGRLQMQAQNRAATFDDVLRDIKERDYRDSHRKTAPLRRADDAVLLDTSELSLQESVDAILNLIRKKTGL